MEPIKHLWQNTFLRNNAVLFAGSIGVGALNYLYYPILGRMLSPSDFGEVQTLISIYLQAAIFLSVLGLVTVGIVSNHDDKAEQHRLISELELLALYIAVALLVLAVALSQELKAFFHFHSALPFISLALVLLVSVPVSFRNAYLQATHRFANLSISQLLASVAKLICSATLVYIGLRTLGAISGLIISTLLTLLFVATRAVRAGWDPPAEHRYWRRLELDRIRPELRYGLLVLAVSLSLTILFSVDVIVVKHYFSPHDAGLYAGIATVARIVYFLTGSTSMVLLASVKPKAPPADNRRLLYQSLAFMTLIGGGATIVFALVPKLLISLLIGDVYLRYAALLPPLAAALFVLTLCGLFSYYFLALRTTTVAVLTPIGVAITIGLLLLQHSDLTKIVYSLLFGSLITLALIVGGGFLATRRGHG